MRCNHNVFVSTQEDSVVLRVTLLALQVYILPHYYIPAVYNVIKNSLTSIHDVQATVYTGYSDQNPDEVRISVLLSVCHARVYADSVLTVLFQCLVRVIIGGVMDPVRRS